MSLPLDPIFVGISGDKLPSEMIEDAKQAVRDAGYEVGDFESIDDGEGYICGSLEIDATFTAFLRGQGYFEAEHDGTKIDAEWP